MQLVTILYAISNNKVSKLYAISNNMKFQILYYQLFTLKKGLKTIKSIDIDYIFSIDTKKQKKRYLWSVKRTQFLLCREQKGKNQKKVYLWSGA
jgi:hypothetical protein